MAASLVASSFAHVYTTSTSTVTLGAAVQVGDVICVAASGQGDNNPACTCSDGLGNTYTLQQASVNDVGGAVQLVVFTAPVTVAGTPVIAVVGIDSDVGLSAVAFRGLASATPDKKGENHANADPLSVSLSPSVTSMLFVAYANQVSNIFSAWLLSATPLGLDTDHIDGQAYLLSQAAGTYAAGVDLSAGSYNDAMVAIWLPEGAAASAALTGTAAAGITEADIVTGGKTIILTLTGGTFIA